MHGSGIPGLQSRFDRSVQRFRFFEKSVVHRCDPVGTQVVAASQPTACTSSRLNVGSASVLFLQCEFLVDLLHLQLQGTAVTSGGCFLPPILEQAAHA